MRWRAVLLSLVLLLVVGNAIAATADMYVFAVSETGEGIPARLIVEVKPGTGRVTLTLNSIVGEDTQRSITDAIRAAVEEAGKNFSSYDYSITIESGAEYVSGPSAGLAIALAVYAAINGKDVPDEVSATGTIDRDGRVGPVGGIYAKAKAAAEVGVKVFLIPKGERYTEGPVQEEIEPGIKVPSEGKVDIVEVAKREWNMDIYEVETLSQAVLIVFEGKTPELNIGEEAEPTPELNFIPPPVPTTYSERFGEVVRELIDELEAELNTPCANPEPYFEEIRKSGESFLERAKIAYSRGYYYTAGNYAYLALVSVSTVNEICEHPSMKNPESLALELYYEELQSRLKDLMMRAQKYILTTANYEWVGGARERLIRAEYTLNAPLTGDPLTIIRTLKSVEYWMKSAEMMLDVADELNGGTELSNMEEFAKSEIIFVEDLISSSKKDVGLAKERLEWAKEAYRRGWYFAAYAEAALAKGVFLSENVPEEKVEERISQLLETTKDYKGMWTELYRNHGLYYERAAREYAKIGNDEKKMEMLRTALQMLEASSEFSILSNSIAVSAVEVVETEEIGVQPIVVGSVLLLIAIVLLLFSLRSSRPRHPSLALIPKEKREEARKILREMALLEQAVKRLEPLSKKDEEGIIEAEIKRLVKRTELLRKRLERLAEPSPPRRSSRHGRGKRR